MGNQDSEDLTSYKVVPGAQGRLDELQQAAVPGTQGRLDKLQAVVPGTHTRESF
jgi:hypothetical protein